MTLILTAATANAVIQVSDRRLTYPKNGRLHDDAANKAVAIGCADGHFAVAFTGLAYIRDLRTDVWLVHQLSRLQVQRLTVGELAASIQDSAGDALSKVRVPRPSRGITFVLAGYHLGIPFVWPISNQMRKGREDTDGISDDFLSYPVFRNGPRPPHETDVFIFGESRAINGTIDRRLKRFNRESFRQPELEVARVMVDLVRAAKRHPNYGHVIGRNCVSVAVLPNGGFLGADYPRNASRRANYPHFVAH